MGGMLAVGLLSATLAAQTSAATRYDNQIQTTVTQKLAAKKQFQEVKSSVEDGIVTLTGTVDLYQRKLDAAKLARKTSNVTGVRNLITVPGPNVPDAQLEQKLARKLTYVRVGYDNTFDYFALGVKDGVVTVEGQDRTGVGRDEALADIALSAAKSGKARAVSLSLKGFYALAKGAQVYVGGDTGPTHLAVAARTPIVGLFGPTEWWRNGSPYSNDVCVERNDVDCRVDCHRRSCSKWICMDIDVGRVLHAVTDRLRRAGRIAAAELVTIG